MSRLIEGLSAAPHNGKLLTQGLSRVHISPARPELGFNGAKITHNDFATMEHTQELPHLKAQFHGEQDVCGHGSNMPYVEYNSPQENTQKDGGWVTMIGQPAPYSERALLVAAASEKQLDNCNEKGQVDALFPAELPPDVRLGYVASLLASLQTAHAMTEDGNRALVIEHLTPDISRAKRQVPRSVALPHGSVGIFDNNHIIPTEMEIDHLQAEQHALTSDRVKWIAGTMYACLYKSLRDSEFGPDSFRMRIRDEMPKGYELLFDISPEALTNPNNIKLVTFVLNAEHQAYEAFSEKLLTGLPSFVTYNGMQYPLKPQPASRDIMYMDENTLVKRKVPIAYSHAGTLESLGVILDRSPDHPKIHPENAVEIFRGRAAVNIENTFSALGLSRAN